MSETKDRYQVAFYTDKELYDAIDEAVERIENYKNRSELLRYIVNLYINGAYMDIDEKRHEVERQLEIQKNNAEVSFEKLASIAEDIATINKDDWFDTIVLDVNDHIQELKDAGQTIDDKLIVAIAERDLEKQFAEDWCAKANKLEVELAELKKVSNEKSAYIEKHLKTGKDKEMSLVEYREEVESLTRQRDEFEQLLYAETDTANGHLEKLTEAKSKIKSLENLNDCFKVAINTKNKDIAKLAGWDLEEQELNWETAIMQIRERLDEKDEQLKQIAVKLGVPDTVEHIIGEIKNLKLICSNLGDDLIEEKTKPILKVIWDRLFPKKEKKDE